MGAGIAIGALGSLALSRVLTALLYGVSATDTSEMGLFKALDFSDHIGL